MGLLKSSSTESDARGPSEVRNPVAWKSRTLHSMWRFKSLLPLTSVELFFTLSRNSTNTGFFSGQPPGTRVERRIGVMSGVTSHCNQ